MRRRGSITLFLAMLLTCFFSAVFAFLEAARVSGLKANSQISTMQAADTVMASYNQALWGNYHLLFWQAPEGDFPDLDALESLQQDAIEGNQTSSALLQKNYYMLQVHLAEVTTSSYQLATDDGGIAFREEAAEMMKYTVGEEAVSAMLAWVTGEEAAEESQTDLESEAIDALEELEAAVSADEASSAAGEGSSAETSSDSGTSGTADVSSAAGTENTETAAGGSSSESIEASTTESAAAGVSITENPLAWVKKMKKNGVLAFVMQEESISQKSIDTSTCIMNRTLESGNMAVSTTQTSIEKMLFYLYLDHYYTDASEESADHVLDYELEYMIAGKDGDQENLKAVVRRLLLMREVTNLAYLESNAEKQQEAAAVAAALTLAVGHPELEPLVKQGILAAWAYAESLSDVRILLEGGKVTLVKTSSQWHTELTNLSTTVFSTSGKDQTEGLTYANYLVLLMWATSDEKLSQRAMDMIEKNEDVRMDQMICRAQCVYVYEASPLFWNFVTLGQNSFGTYQFQDQTGISFPGSG
ncbi:MAG: DUF5702 domain-containing protein [Lachnospiraceae bacterium]|nr:DUF5702 domain-containing protein [Lachnospiraceae bacterium]